MKHLVRSADAKSIDALPVSASESTTTEAVFAKELHNPISIRDEFERVSDVIRPRSSFCDVKYGSRQGLSTLGIRDQKGNLEIARATPTPNSSRWKKIVECERKHPQDAQGNHQLQPMSVDQGFHCLLLPITPSPPATPAAVPSANHARCGSPHDITYRAPPVLFPLPR